MKKRKILPLEPIVQPQLPILDTSPIIPQRNKIKNLLNIYQRPDFTEKQKEFIELALNKDTKLMFVEGPAGSSKTFMAVYVSLLLMNQRKISDIVFVRSAVESSEKSIGYLPGLISEKLSPYIQPLMDKLEEFLSKKEIELLQKEERISGTTIGFLRGLSFNAKSLILDEAQNTTAKEIITFITRVGMFSKSFVVGDKLQSDINCKSGFIKILNCFDDEESRQNGICVFRFTEEDIVRSPLTRFIVNRLNKVN
jgi:phosphate starvation-inducible PhoH-like protein